MIDIRRESDIDILRQVAVIQDRELSRLMLTVRRLKEENARLRGENPSPAELELELAKELLALRERMLFGRSSEKRPHAGCDPAAESAQAGTAPRKGHGPAVQPSLPVVEEVIEIPESGRTCPSCGGTLKPLSDEAEESQEIDFVKREFVLVKRKRLKYRCACNACVVTAPAPLRLIPGGRYSPAFAVEVAASKYLDHLPLERQARIMGREGLDVTSQTLWDQIEALGRWLKPTGEAIRESVLASSVILCDETTWPYLGPKGDGRPGKHTAWCGTARHAAFYRILPSRSADAAREVLGDYGGIVMADGYTAYESLSQKGGAFKLVHCWAHVRRKFVEAEDFFPEECEKALDLIGKLYAVEREVPKAGLGADEETLREASALLLALRQERSKPVVREIQDLLMDLKPRVLPASVIGKAVAYTLRLWPGLTAFLEDAAIPLDNNGAERALRGPVVGRKNHYGSKSLRGTQVAALLYTLFETAKLSGVDPKAYVLRAALAAIRNPGTVTLPWDPDTAL
jgi:transposase